MCNPMIAIPLSSEGIATAGYFDRGRLASAAVARLLRDIVPTSASSAIDRPQ